MNYNISNINDDLLKNDKDISKTNNSELGSLSSVFERRNNTIKHAENKRQQSSIGQRDHLLHSENNNSNKAMSTV